MGKLSKTFLKGASGQQYRFDIYTWDTMFRQGLAGVYFIARRYKLSDGSFTLDPIYISERDDLSTLFGFHMKQNCFEKYGANVKCIYLSQDEARRKAIAKDLIEEHEPYCND